MQMNWKNLLSTQRFRTKNGEIIPTVTPSTQEGADALRTDFHIERLDNGAAFVCPVVL